VVSFSQFGVAKNANLVAVKVLQSDGTGTLAAVVAGVNYVAQQKAANRNTPMVASKFPLFTILSTYAQYVHLIAYSALFLTDMSLGSGGTSSTIDAAVSGAIAQGIVIVTSAGNDNQSACLQSPAAVNTAITVGATDYDDSRASYSNYGPCVAVFA
jgi:cerevisin